MNRFLVPIAASLLVAACGGKVEEGPRPQLTIVGADTLDFGTVLAGTSRTLEVTLENRAGDGPRIRPLERIAIGVSGAGLVVEHDCPATLEAAESCTIRVGAEPQQAGALSGSLVVASNADASPQTLPVSGTVVAALSPAAPAFAWEAGSSGDFGTADVDSQVQRVFTIVNRGNAPGTVASVELVEASADWTVANGCTALVQPLGNCIATVTFTPSTTDAQTAELRFTDSYHSGFSAPRIALTGSGQ